MRLLYVEDNPLVQEVTAELLAQEDRQVVAVSNAEDALRVFNESTFDVIITDISLPRMSGLDLARKILNTSPRVPIIIASGYALASMMQTLGPTVRTIVKPFEGHEIDSLIADLTVVA